MLCVYCLSSKSRYFSGGNIPEGLLNRMGISKNYSVRSQLISVCKWFYTYIAFCVCVTKHDFLFISPLKSRIASIKPLIPLKINIIHNMRGRVIVKHCIFTPHPIFLTWIVFACIPYSIPVERFRATLY